MKFVRDFIGACFTFLLFALAIRLLGFLGDKFIDLFYGDKIATIVFISMIIVAFIVAIIKHIERKIGGRG